MWSGLLAAVVSCMVVTAAPAGSTRTLLVPEQEQHAAVTNSYSEHFFVPGLFYGLTNQRWSLLKALVASRVLNFTMVLPRWSIDYNESGGADFMPFDYFYSSKHLIEYARRHHNTTVVEALPPELFPACLSQTQNSRQQHCAPPWAATLRAWAAKHGVVCLIATCTFNIRLDGFSHNDMLDEFRPGLHPSALFESEVEAIEAALQQRFNQSRYHTVHVRTEADWHSACFNPGSGLPAHNEYCYSTEQEISDYLQSTARLPAGSLIFVASGDPLDSMKHLCSRYRCWNRELVRPVLGAGIVDKLTSRAFLDFLLARRGQRFIGNRYSTFSVELAAEYKHFGLGKAEYYNRPLPSAAASRDGAGATHGSSSSRG